MAHILLDTAMALKTLHLLSIISIKLSSKHVPKAAKLWKIFGRKPMNMVQFEWLAFKPMAIRHIHWLNEAIMPVYSCRIIVNIHWKTKILFYKNCKTKNFELFCFSLVFIYFRPDVKLDFIDHIVGNMPDNEMENTTRW